MALSHTEIERRIVRKMVKLALARGYMISVNDGEEWAVKGSKKIMEIMDAIQSTDSDMIRFRSSTGAKVGDCWLVYGNGFEVISDYTCTLDDFMAPISAYAETFDR
jgi:hypothetical protein